MKVPPVVRYQLPLLVWLLAILGLSAIPNMPTVKFPISPDKIAHAGIYFVLCMLSRRAFFHQEKWPWLKKHPMMAAVFFTVIYGILDEVHQLFVPGRWADVYDAMADALGAILFAGWFWILSQREKGPA